MGRSAACPRKVTCRERFDDVKKVASTVTYKSEHWLKLADGSRKAPKLWQAETMKLPGLHFRRGHDGGGFVDKQFDRIIIPRLELLPEKRRICGHDGKMSCSKNRTRNAWLTGITVAEARVVVKKAYGSTFESIIAEVEQAVYLTDSLL